ncbi:hypothetical protein VSP20_04365 [Myroides phaeus]|uniref:hypothetical protein n=1 Tax=Myroides phaeus TaxID=702745 RepID=UPI002DB5952C|nr:hypothetical protein [Myroides phaeus]MEC4116195.1 hypothetical protein [Myroides phaeus]
MKNQVILGLLLSGTIVVGCNKKGDSVDVKALEGIESSNLETHPEILSTEEIDIGAEEIDEVKLNMIYEQTVEMYKYNLGEKKQEVKKMTSKEVDAVIDEYMAICNKQSEYIAVDGLEDAKVFQEMGENVTKMEQIIEKMSYALPKMDKEDGKKWVKAWLKGIEIAEK